MYCEFDHVKIPIPEGDWKCPKCGVGVEAENNEEGWLIVDSINWGCAFLHNSDTITCGICGHGMTGKEFARWYAKKKNQDEER